MSILSRLRQLISTGNTLQQAVDIVVPGADVAFWEAAVNRSPEESKPKRRSTRRAPARRRPGRTTLPATSATAQATERGRATVELVGRVNGHEPDGGNSWGGGPVDCQAILVNLPGECRVLEVRR